MRIWAIAGIGCTALACKSSSHAGMVRDAGAMRDAGRSDGSVPVSARPDAGAGSAGHVGAAGNVAGAPTGAGVAAIGGASGSVAGAGDDDAGMPACAADEQLIFQDTFSASKLDWKVCEEIVGTGCSVCGGVGSCPANACYASGLATIASDAGGMKVSAGRAQAAPAHQSDHVIAGHQLSLPTLEGIVWYRVTATIPGSLSTTGQTGPELSVQSTDAVHHTFTAGVQYLANVFDRPGHWSLWSAAGWHDLTSDLHLPATQLLADTPYAIALGMNYTTRRFLGFSVRTANASPVIDLNEQQLAAYAIVPEAKGFAAATVITLEAENRHNGCDVATKPKGDGKSYTYAVVYDDVTLCSAP